VDARKVVVTKVIVLNSRVKKENSRRWKVAAKRSPKFVEKVVLKVVVPKESLKVAAEIRISITRVEIRTSTARVVAKLVPTFPNSP
jgi:hypothetical protein